MLTSIRGDRLAVQSFTNKMPKDGVASRLTQSCSMIDLLIANNLTRSVKLKLLAGPNEDL